MKKRLALIGNQNSGKTTLFNALTSSHQHCGNFPGVTVEKKIGLFNFDDMNYEVVDLPGIYSLSPYSHEEIVSVQYLLEEKADLILNILDASHLQRSLYLTLQLVEFNIPMICLLNMMDEIHQKRIIIDIEQMEDALGVPIFCLSKRKENDLKKLLPLIEETLFKKYYAKDLSIGAVHKYMLKIAPLIQNTSSYPLRFCLSCLLLDGETFLHKLHLPLKNKQEVMTLMRELECVTGVDHEMAIIMMRYQWIDTLVFHAVYKPCEHVTLSEYIDNWILHPLVGLPTLIGIMLGILYCTFFLLGEPLQNIMNSLLEYISHYMFVLLKTMDVAPMLITFIQQGIVGGIGAVLSFLPMIIILFFFLSLLEDSGLLARFAFMFDYPLRLLGLSGRSAVSIIMGFGCSVPAILASRILTNSSEKERTIRFILFVSCSAKLPVYSMMIHAFFLKNQYIVMLLLYSIDLFIGFFYAYIMNHWILSQPSIPFILELPVYRFPTFKNIYLGIKNKSIDFIKKAFTIIFLSSIIIWLFTHFNVQLELVNDSSQSILAMFSLNLIRFFRPIGLSDWRIISALISGVTAKESVVSTLSVLMGTTSLSATNAALSELFTPQSALSFLVFGMLYTPCITTIITIKNEMHSVKKTLEIILVQTFIAYCIAGIVYFISTHI